MNNNFINYKFFVKNLSNTHYKISLPALIVLFSFLVMLVIGCSSNLAANDLDTSKDSYLGNVNISLSTQDFNDKGYKYGDSVDVTFSNGKTYSNIPYYSFYYAKTNEFVLCGYKNDTDLSLGITQGGSAWDDAGLKEGDTASISLNQSGKYLDVQNAMNVSYSDKREDFSSDEVFANFRVMNGGSLKDNIFYRSASPCDNSHNRAKYANDLAEKAGVQYFVNISDTQKKYDKYKVKDDFSSYYYDTKKNENKVEFMGLPTAYQSDEFKKGTATAFQELIKHDGPYLIHCVEGKDRTGFYGILVLGLAGADYQSILNDYMLTYKNYYGITQESNPESYNVIKQQRFDDYIEYLCHVDGGVTPSNDAITNGCIDYLNSCGLSDQDISQLKSKILK